MRPRGVVSTMDGRPEAPTEGGDHREQSVVLADLRQRWVLSILLDRDRPMPVRELGFQVAVREAGVEPSDVLGLSYRPVQLDLHHRCLPKLEAVGWVERYPEGVVADEPLSIETGGLSLPDLRDPEDPHWEPVCALLARPLRREVVAVLADRHSVTIDDLATELLDRRDPSRGTGPRGERRLRTELHHTDLPKLAEVGLVEYDAAERTIASRRCLSIFAEQRGLGT